MDGFLQKNPIFQKSDKGSKFAVECDWISDNSQHVTKKEISKTRLVIRKNSWFFKIAKSSIVALQGHWKSKISRNVQKLVLLNRINVFFGKKMWFS